MPLFHFVSLLTGAFYVGLLGVAGMMTLLVIASGSFPKIPYVKRTSKMKKSASQSMTFGWIGSPQKGRLGLFVAGEIPEKVQDGAPQ